MKVNVNGLLDELSFWLDDPVDVDGKNSENILVAVTTLELVTLVVAVVVVMDDDEDESLLLLVGEGMSDDIETGVFGADNDVLDSLRSSIFKFALPFPLVFPFPLVLFPPPLLLPLFSDVLADNFGIWKFLSNDCDDCEVNNFKTSLGSARGLSLDCGLNSFCLSLFPLLLLVAAVDIIPGIDADLDDDCKNFGVFPLVKDPEEFDLWNTGFTDDDPVFVGNVSPEDEAVNGVDIDDIAVVDDVDGTADDNDDALFIFSDDDDFLDAGPLLTPGFNPVCVFVTVPVAGLGAEDVVDDWIVEDDEEVVDNEDVDTVVVVLEAKSFVLVLLIVNFIPSELGLTIYSVFLFEDEGAVGAGGGIGGLTIAWGDWGGGGGVGLLAKTSSDTCCADFNLSITALKDPFRFLAGLLEPAPPAPNLFDPSAKSCCSVNKSNWDPDDIIVKSNCFNLTEEDFILGLPPDKFDDFFSRSRSLSRLPPPDEEDFEEDDTLSLEFFELGELVADFNADMLGFPPPEPPEICLGEAVPWCFGLCSPECFGLLWWTGECFGLILLLEPDDDEDLDDGTGDDVNLRINPDGDSGAPSDDLILTVTGLLNGSCLDGIFSGGPIGLSSRLRLRCFVESVFDLSESFLVPLLLLLPPFPLLEPLEELFFVSVFEADEVNDDVEAVDAPGTDDVEDEFDLLIGVIVIDDGKFCVGFELIGMISMPGRLSKPISLNTEL